MFVRIFFFNPEMFSRSLLFVFLVSNFCLVLSKEFELIYRQGLENKTNFYEANRYCHENYQNGRLAIISDKESNEKIKRLVYEVAGSKFYLPFLLVFFLFFW